MFNYEIIIKNADGTETTKKCKSVRQMATDMKIPYHNLKAIADSDNTKNKYANSLTNNLMTKIRINKIMEF